MKSSSLVAFFMLNVNGINEEEVRAGRGIVGSVIKVLGKWLYEK
ncbi:MAG: hypothetical protein NT010_07410 [Proteobacteria bacterium]|nr:hypothetical protein [Pseudomonadota bacterium]